MMFHQILRSEWRGYVAPSPGARGGDSGCLCAEPNTPGKFIVWFRNETTLLVLWQPPYPPGAYTHYKVRTPTTRSARDNSCDVMYLNIKFYV